jgi:hypothetical protein
MSRGRDRHPQYWNISTGSIGRWLYAQRGLRRRFLSPRGTSPSPPGSPETVEQEAEAAQPRPGTPRAQEGARRP